MKRRTVKQRIFLSNTVMVLLILSVFLVINIIFVKLYFRSFEAEMITISKQTLSAGLLEDFIEDWTLHNNNFFALFFIDGIICIVVLIIISQFFTKKLTAHIMKPLNILKEATYRIQINDFTRDIEYVGEKEFEDICLTFNEMQHYLLESQNRNKKYEKKRADMIAGISHDLRTPLTAIKGAIKAILDGVAFNQQQLLEMADRKTDEMNTLLNSLFELSKLETGNMPMRLHCVDLVSCLKTYVKIMQDSLDKETLIMEDSLIDVKVKIDVEMLYRILNNLVENSKKYADREFLEMKIVLNQRDDFIDICFLDNGVGIEQDKLPYIFDEFYRGDESRHDRDGNGLGLYIVKCLVESMNGYVKAESDNGLYIHLMLPVDKKG